MREIAVFTDKWNGKIKEQFEWHNPDQKDDATITQVGTDWPFTLPSPITVKAGSKLPCGLASKPNTYNYNANPCKTLGNPKTVIIS